MFNTPLQKNQGYDNLVLGNSMRTGTGTPKIKNTSQFAAFRLDVWPLGGSAYGSLGPQLSQALAALARGLQALGLR